MITHIVCPHCNGTLKVESPDVGYDMDKEALAALGKAITETKVVHAIMDCPAFLDGGK